LQAIRDQSSGSVIETISDTFLNAFTKVQKPEERFVDMKENVDKLADNLNTVERLYSRISKRQQGMKIFVAIRRCKSLYLIPVLLIDLAQDYTMFANSIDGLSNLETGISSSLGQFAETSRKFSGAIKEMVREQTQLSLQGNPFDILPHSAIKKI
jgi:sorting nexin-4